jgi:hypothetical protein
MSSYSIRDFLTPKKNRSLQEYIERAHAEFNKSLNQTQKNTRYETQILKTVRRKKRARRNELQKLKIPGWVAFAVCTIPYRGNNKFAIERARARNRFRLH